MSWSASRRAGCTPTVTRLARKLGAAYGYDRPVPGSDVPLGEALLAPHRSYLAPLAAALDAGLVKALAHLTGGGFQDNIPRCLPPGLGATVDTSTWETPPLFLWLQEAAGIDSDEAHRIWNMGIGIVAVVAPDSVEAFRAAVPETTWVVGSVTVNRGSRAHVTARLVVLVSGGGTNLQAILDACASGTIDAEVVAVVSNRADAFGLERARRAGIEAHHVPVDGRSRAIYDGVLSHVVADARPDLVVLAGWMRLLTNGFLRRFPVINIHPALPGAFPGIARHRASVRGMDPGDDRCIRRDGALGAERGCRRRTRHRRTHGPVRPRRHARDVRGENAQHRTRALRRGHHLGARARTHPTTSLPAATTGLS